MDANLYVCQHCPFMFAYQPFKSKQCPTPNKDVYFVCFASGKAAGNLLAVFKEDLNKSEHEQDFDYREATPNVCPMYREHISAIHKPTTPDFLKIDIH